MLVGAVVSTTRLLVSSRFWFAGIEVSLSVFPYWSYIAVLIAKDDTVKSSLLSPAEIS